MQSKRLTAKSLGLIACRFCHCLVNAEEINTKHITCPTCGAAMHSRIPHSIEYTSAYLIAAILLYFPANFMPVMSSVYLGQSQTNTILSGVIELAAEGFWPLALIVFIASIIVPLIKILVLVMLVVSVKLKLKWNLLDRTRAYRITESIGRWSMVDIYVIAILVALVQFGPLASVQAERGALPFAAVIILTMFAANSFDTRLMWDTLDTSYEP